MTKLCFAAGVFMAVLLLASWLGANRLSGGTVNTQNFTPARYAMLAAPVQVAMQSGGDPYRQDAVVKLDTVTGRTWVLQLTVRAATDPTVVSAVWAPVGSSAADGQ